MNNLLFIWRLYLPLFPSCLVLMSLAYSWCAEWVLAMVSCEFFLCGLSWWPFQSYTSQFPKLVLFLLCFLFFLFFLRLQGLLPPWLLTYLVFLRGRFLSFCICIVLCFYLFAIALFCMILRPIFIFIWIRLYTHISMWKKQPEMM